MSNTSLPLETATTKSDLTEEDFAAAFGLLVEVCPELMEYIITYYPPELMLHISPELCRRLDQQEKSLSPQD